MYKNLQSWWDDADFFMSQSFIIDVNSFIKYPYLFIKLLDFFIKYVRFIENTPLLRYNVCI